MKYKIIATKHFQKDVKRCKKRNLPMEKLKKVIRLLEETGQLPSEYKPHKLSGQYKKQLFHYGLFILLQFAKLQSFFDNHKLICQNFCGIT